MKDVKLQENHLALNWEQKDFIKFIIFFILWVTFALLDPDRIHSGSGSPQCW
jgi:hypothetical protein